MFKIEGGGMRFYQWDTNRRLIVEDSKIEQVHFCNTTDECSLVAEVYAENGKRFVNVPNILLQDTWPIRVYGYDSYTKHYAVFNIIARTKPADYVYTETEIKSWDAIVKRVDEIEATVTTEGVKTAVEEYLQENPIDVDMTGYASEEYVNDAIETIELTPGPQGKPGKDGKDGKDYVLTTADKEEIAAQVGTTETWTFTLASGESVTKEVLIK